MTKNVRKLSAISIESDRETRSMTRERRMSQLSDQDMEFIINSQEKKQKKSKKKNDELQEDEIVVKSKKSKKEKKSKKQVEEEENVELESKKSKKEKKSKKQDDEVDDVEIETKKTKKQKKTKNQDEDDEIIQPVSQKKVKKESVISVDQVKQFRDEHNMVLSGTNCESSDYYPILDFNGLQMSESIMAITKNYSKPTPIQSQSWPIVLNNRDAIAIAETGSGKTLSFLLPAFSHIYKNGQQNSKFPQIIVLSPTRELANQIFEVCVKAQEQTGLKSVCVYGGVDKRPQVQALKLGAQIIIGTPGRVNDLIQEGSLIASHVTMMVLDEADRMLDLGFEPSIKQAYNSVSKQRQSIMFSATWPQAVQQIAEQFLYDPIMVKIGTKEGSANKRVTQHVEVMENHSKQGALMKLLEKYYKSQKDRIIIFVLYKLEAVRVEEFIQSKGLACVSLHGDKSQTDRNKAFSQFKSGEIKLLIATDVAARGLDVPNVEVVINYSFPLTVSDYVHRIGRTGRAGKVGISHTFFNPKADSKLAGDLCQIMKEAGQYVPPNLEAFGPTIHKKEKHDMYGDHFKPNLDMSLKPVKTKLC